MAYQMYRSTSIGQALDAALYDFIQEGLIPSQLYGRIMVVFDKAINEALENRVNIRTLMQAEHLLTYRFVDNVWTFILEGVEFNHPIWAFYSKGASLKRVKIVACDANIQKRLQ